MSKSTETFLLDGSLLVALTIDSHEHHRRAIRWFAKLKSIDKFALCSVTEGTLLRMHMAFAADPSSAAAWETLAAIKRHPKCTFFEIGFSYLEVDQSGLIGRKQITDAWLAELARRSECTLATLDVGLSTLHSDVTTLVPVI